MSAPNRYRCVHMSQQVIVLPIAVDHPAYVGHFPGRPILPGVVLLDGALRALVVQHGCEIAGGQIKSAKFLSPVLPGEPLALHYTPSSTGNFHFEIRSHDRSVASGTFSFLSLDR